MFIVTQPVPVHVCPLQSDVSESAQRVLAEGGALCASELHTPASPSDADHTQHHTTCHCIGTCCATAILTPARSTHLVPVPAAIAVQREQYPAVNHAFEAPDYRLPPATAPPVA